MGSGTADQASKVVEIKGGTDDQESEVIEVGEGR